MNEYDFLIVGGGAAGFAALSFKGDISKMPCCAL